MDIPALGLGTYRLKDQVAFNSVKTALEIGYRLFDTAQIYENENEIGTAILESGIPRGEIFITTKIWISNLSKDKLIPSLRDSLVKLKTDYVDLTLIHWPSPKNEIPLEESIASLMEAKALGLTKEIGVSNFPINELKKVIKLIGSEEIYTNQVEVHPFLQNKKLIEFCNDEEILVTAYMPLAYGKILHDQTLIDIAKKYDVSVVDITLTWLYHQDLIIIPSSTNRQNMENNLNFPEIKLNKVELKKIAALDIGDRLASPEFAPEWDK